MTNNGSERKVTTFKITYNFKNSSNTESATSSQTLTFYLSK